jgi:anti-sigma factor RsiW
MSCQETELLIHGYLDNELDLANSLEIERHLEECAACAHAWEQQLELRQALRTMAPRYRAPASLRRRFEGRPRAPWLTMAAAAAVIVGAIGLWSLPRAIHGDEQELAAAHIRSLMANHLADVPSTDQHTVKPWFSGKLDFSPVVKDFADRGFRLTGGRLDYLGGRTVAALVYQRRQHVINVFTWPAAADRSPKTTARQGYNIVTWARSGMAYSLISDLNARELEELAALLQQ